MPFQSVWTTEMDDLLHRFVVVDGASLAQAAAKISSERKISITRNSAIGRAHRLGIKNNAPRENTQRSIVAKRVRKVSPRPRVQAEKKTTVKTSFRSHS